MNFINDFYQQHLLKVEWPLYPTHLLQSQQTATLEKLKAAYEQHEDRVLVEQLGFDRNFSDSISANGPRLFRP